MDRTTFTQETRCTTCAYPVSACRCGMHKARPAVVAALAACIHPTLDPIDAQRWLCADCDRILTTAEAFPEAVVKRTAPDALSFKVSPETGRRLSQILPPSSIVNPVPPPFIVTRAPIVQAPKPQKRHKTAAPTSPELEALRERARRGEIIPLTGPGSLSEALANAKNQPRA